MLPKFSKPLLVNFLLFAFLLGANLESEANPNKFQRFFYKPRAGVGIPQNSIGGTTRSENCTIACPVALVPADTVALTIAERPSIFFFVPKVQQANQDSKQSAKARFQLFDQDNRVYQTNFDVTQTGGIMQFNIPADAPALELGKNYQWRLIVRDASATNELKGFVRRVTLDATAAKTANSMQTAELYAQQGIWLDLVKTLAEVKTPEASTQIQDLLKSEKLEAIATQPLLECCKPQ
jgi:hypothetical protein